MTREEAKEFIAQSVKSDVDMALVADVIKALEQEPKEITLDEVKEYCRKRCLILVTNQLFYELTHHQGPILDKVRAEVEQLPTEKCTETCSIRIDADVFKENVLAILNKYKAESEKQEDGNDD